ncbi:MAG: SPOR domain-containing protein [Beijerinckiaceae bacterium]|nr:MAG: SPOR domain-containing protein [Beijerinckiaceae bacterium]
MIQPRMVKTVAVRPDGTIIRDDGSVQNPPDSTGSTQSASADAGQTATAASAPAQPAATGGEAAPALPIAVAEPPAANHAAPSHSSPVRVADRGSDDADDATASHASGAYAVQLTARATESEARHALQELARKYGSILGTRHLKFHRAKVNGKSVFRVRVSDLSRDSANKLCKKLQAKGGSCFVAHDRS